MTDKEFTQGVMRRAMEGLEEGLTGLLGEKPGIVLLVWPGDDPRLANYISNCSRQDTSTAMIEVGLRLKSGRKPGGK